MNLRLLFILSLFTCLTYGQDEPEKLPNVTPPSPEAKAMTKYGDLPMNEFNGMVNFSVPLYSYKVYNLEVPISINYTGAGVKVNELPTWVGMNWTLNAGGVITRTVKDVPDEAANQRIYFNDNQIVDLYTTTPLTDGTAESAYIKNILENDQIDNEVDMFQFSFAGYSGSFYLDQNFQPVLLKNDSPLKIVIEGSLFNNKTFKIVTPDGVVYTFGGNDATETTTTRYQINGNVNSQDTFDGITAFYLTSIQHPIFGEVRFQYVANLSESVTVSNQIQKRRRLILTTGEEKCFDMANSAQEIPAPVPLCANYPNLHENDQQITVYNRVLNPKYLSRIYNYYNSEEVIFHSNAVDNANFKRVLRDIEIRKGGSNPYIIKTIDFEYQGFQNSSSPFGMYSDITKRFFLHKIVFDKNNLDSPNTQNGRRNEVYMFNYNSLDNLPYRFSFAQDFMGYYNGKENNTSSIPNNPQFNSYNNANVANRTSDFYYASMGTLTDIYYPTSGHTSFEYEPTSFFKEKITVPYHFEAYRNKGSMHQNQLTNGLPAISESGEVTFGGTIPFSQQVDIYITMDATEDMGANVLPESEKAILKIKNLDTNATILQEQVELTNQEHLKTFVIPFTFNTDIHYKISIEIYHQNPNDASNPIYYDITPLKVGVSFDVCTGYQRVDGYGVRLKKQTDFSSSNGQTNIKRYYYSDINHINPDVNELPFYDTFQSNYSKIEKEIYNALCNISPPCFGSPFMEFYYLFEWVLSDKFDYSSTINDGLYEKVTISYGGDNFEKGGTEKRFQVFDGYGILPIPTNLSSTTGIVFTNHKDLIDDYSPFDYVMPSFVNGNLIEEKLFQKKNGLLYKIKQNNYTYDNSELNHVNNIVGKKMYNVFFFTPTITLDNILSNYFIGQYKLTSRRNEMTSKQTVEYIQPVPLSAEDESSYDKIETVENYEYNNFRGLPTKISTVTSTGETSEVHNYYVNQASLLNNLPSGQADHLTILNNLNVVSSPVQVEKYKGTDKLFSKRTLYKNFGTTVHPTVLPEIIQTGKADQNLEDRVLLSKYDTFGNLTEMSYKDGSVTKLYYNSDNQVMMKIDNYIAPTTGTFAGGTITENDINTATTSNPCAFNIEFPMSQVTMYIYDSNTKQITEIIDPKCKSTHYVYNNLHQLIRITDDENKILQEFDSNYKRY